MDIPTLVQNRRPGYSLERPFYTHPDIFQLELEKIWMRYWIYVGHASQLPDAGSYFTYQIGTEPVLLVRGEDGQVRAFMNVCRHRGSLVCNEPQGRAKKLVCPYHQWVYDLDGRLRTAKLAPDDFDLQEHGLHPIHCRDLEGLLFISFAENPPDFGLLEQAYLPDLRPYAMRRTKIAYSSKYVVQSNWKLIAENFRECYHCGVGHPEYCSVIIGANLNQSRERAQQVRSEKERVWAEKGLPARPIRFEDTGWYFHDRYPYQPGFVTMSLDGQPVAPPLGNQPDRDIGVWTIVQFPNFWLDINNDYAWSMRMTPLGPTATEIETSWLVREDLQEGRDYDLERLVWFWRTTGEQDWKLCEDNQAGVNSLRYTPGPYLEAAESGPDQFVNWYLKQLV
jgi:phenylpropionate dioxygenase-like ring-hydroxylating dioxygenase large terminal subunit